MSYDDIVNDAFAMDKAVLERTDERGENRMKAVGDELGEDFVDYRAEADRPELTNLRRSVYLGNHSNQGTVEVRVHRMAIPDVLYEVVHALTDN